MNVYKVTDTSPIKRAEQKKILTLSSNPGAKWVHNAFTCVLHLRAIADAKQTIYLQDY